MVALTSDELLVAAPNTAESLVASLSHEDDDDEALGSALGKPALPADTTKSLSATAPADDDKVATTSTDGAGVIEVAVAVLDGPFTKMRELLFSASASDYTGAPPTAVTVHFDLGDAVPGVHFAGMPLNPQPGTWVAYHFDMDYKTWVNGADGRASNELEWEVKFDVNLVNGAWVVQPGHVP